MKCFTDKKSGVLIPGCMSVAVHGSIDYCVCYPTTYHQFEKKEYQNKKQLNKKNKMKNFKLFVDDKDCKEIVKHLKNIGYNSIATTMDATCSFIFVKDGLFRLGNFNRRFQESDLPRLTADEVLALKPEPQFKPFDKVLTRDEDYDTWEATIFIKMDDEMYKCINSHMWDQCIAYEGNEHLHGTDLKPE